MRDGWYSIVKSPVIKQRKNNWNSPKRIFYRYKRAYFLFFSLFFLFTILTDWPALLKSRRRLKLVQSLKFHVYSLMLTRWTRYVAGNDAPLGRTWLESAIVSIIRSPPDKFVPRLYPESNFCLRFQFSRSCAFSLRLVETGRKKATRSRKFNVRLVSCDQRFDTSGEQNRHFQWDLNETVNSEYRDRIDARQKGKIAVRCEQQRFATSPGRIKVAIVRRRLNEI